MGYALAAAAARAGCRVVLVSGPVALRPPRGARVLRVDEGILETGRPADLVLLQEPRGGTRDDPLRAIENGDIPGICGVIIDGQIRALKSRNTPAPAREAVVHTGGAR